MYLKDLKLNKIICSQDIKCFFWLEKHGKIFPVINLFYISQLKKFKNKKHFLNKKIFYFSKFFLFRCDQFYFFKKKRKVKNDIVKCYSIKSKKIRRKYNLNFEVRVDRKYKTAQIDNISRIIFKTIYGLTQTHEIWISNPDGTGLVSKKNNIYKKKKLIKRFMLFEILLKNFFVIKKYVREKKKCLTENKIFTINKGENEIGNVFKKCAHLFSKKKRSNFFVELIQENFSDEPSKHPILGENFSFVNYFDLGVTSISYVEKIKKINKNISQNIFLKASNLILHVLPTNSSEKAIVNEYGCFI